MPKFAQDIGGRVETVLWTLGSETRTLYPLPTQGLCRGSGFRVEAERPQDESGPALGLRGRSTESCALTQDDRPGFWVSI